MKTITVNIFDEASIDKAIAELDAYKKSLNDKCIKLIELMCREGEEYALTRWASHVWSGETYHSVMGYREGNIGIVSVSGNHALWVEFGTGTASSFYPGTANPGEASIEGWVWPGAEHGSDPNGWTYYDEYTGEFRHTHGQPTDPIMWNTAQMLRDEVSNYAKKVFNG